MTATVRAAGGILRRVVDGEVQIVLVHRPRYDDWSFPKGKCEVGEGDEAAAVREVEEETGLRCTLGHELATVAYVDHRGRPKVVRYWEMAVADAADFEPNDEVDALEWLPLADVERRLSYARDVEVLDSFRRFAGLA